MLKKLILAAAALAIAAPALADGRGHGRHYKHHQHHHYKHYKHHYHRPIVVMPPPRVYYAPPAPVYYAPPPVVYRPAPVYSEPHGQVSIRLHFPL
jgi:hypothetical protein